MNCSDSPEIRIPSCCMAAQFLLKKLRRNHLKRAAFIFERGLFEAILAFCLLSFELREKN